MLIAAGLYKEGKKIKTLSMQEIAGCSFDENEFFWAALFDPTEEEIKSLFSKVSVHELALEDLHHGNQISKIEEYEDSLFAVLKQIEVNKETHEIMVGDVYLFVGSNYIISIRKGVGKSFDNVRRVVEKNSKLLSNGSGYVLYAIIDSVVDRYFPIVTELELELDLLENKVFDSETAIDTKGDIIQKLHHMKGKIRTVRNCIAPLLDSTHKLFGGRVPSMCENLDNYYRDTHDHLLRISTNLDTLLEIANSSIQTSVAMITIEENKITKKLASWAAMFGAVTFMAGVWGMNFKHMPELDWEYGYLMAIASFLIVGLTIRYKFKKVGWL